MGNGALGGGLFVSASRAIGGDEDMGDEPKKQPYVYSAIEKERPKAARAIYLLSKGHKGEPGPPFDKG
jgi:hypothetical protein